MGIPRMRIATDVLAEIKALDPDTRITLHYIRSIINQGKVPVRKAGTKKLVDLDKVLEYLARGDEDEKTPTGEIRRVELRKRLMSAPAPNARNAAYTASAAARVCWTTSGGGARSGSHTGWWRTLGVRGCRQDS